MHCSMLLIWKGAIKNKNYKPTVIVCSLVCFWKDVWEKEARLQHWQHLIILMLLQKFSHATFNEQNWKFTSYFFFSSFHCFLHMTLYPWIRFDLISKISVQNFQPENIYLLNDLNLCDTCGCGLQKACTAMTAAQAVHQLVNGQQLILAPSVIYQILSHKDHQI